MNKVLFSSKRNNWTTPKELFNILDNQFHFTLDACADEYNHLCDKYYTEQDSCLNHSFENEVVFMNPPYSRNMRVFIKKCYDEARIHNAKIVLLVPSRTDTQWFHNYIYNRFNVQIEFIKGRLHFDNSIQGAPFPSMLVYFNIDRFQHK